jgi:hypothetical protein
MTLRVDRRPRAPGQRGDRQCGRLGTGLRRRFAGRAEIASDCEIRRPEARRYNGSGDNDGSGGGAPPTCMGGGPQWPHLQRPIKDPTRCAPVHARGCPKPMASTRHLMEGFIPPITGADVGPRNQIRRYARRAATSGFRSGAGEARPAPSWRAAGGWVISPNPRFECRFPD